MNHKSVKRYALAHRQYTMGAILWSEEVYSLYVGGKKYYQIFLQNLKILSASLQLEVLF